MAAAKNFKVAIVDGHMVLDPHALPLSPQRSGPIPQAEHVRPQRQWNLQAASRSFAVTVAYEGASGYHLMPQFMVPYEKSQLLNEGFIFNLGSFPEVKEALKEAGLSTRRLPAKIDGESAKLLERMREIDFAGRFGIREWKMSEGSVLVSMSARDPLYRIDRQQYAIQVPKSLRQG